MGIRRNLSPNPSLKTTTLGNATNWTSSPTGYARQTGVSGMDRTTGFGGSGAIDIVTTPRFAAVAGAQYMASVQIKTGGSNTFKVLVNWYTGTASGTFISNAGSGVSFTVNGTQRVEVGPYTAPVGAGGGYLRVIDLDSTTVTLAALLVEQTNASGNSYFDGDTTGAGWEGVSGNSTSSLLTGADSFALADSGVKVNSAVGPTGGDGASLSESAAVVASGTVNQDIHFADSGMVVALTYDARRGRNRISAFGLPSSAIRAEVSVRPAGKTTFTPVRGGKIATAGGTFARAVDDYEFAAGVANTYRIRALSSQENVPNVVVAQATATLPAVLDDVWLKFIAQPALNRRVTLTGWGEVARTSRAAFYEVQNRPDPIAVTDVHSSRKVTVTLRTATIDDGDTLDEALKQGLPLFLHTPLTIALPSLYAVAGDYSYTRPAARSTVRLWTLPLTEVSAPPPSVVGAASTWQTILDSYESWADLLAAVRTWQDVVS